MTLQHLLDNFILDDEPIYFTKDINENGGSMARKSNKCPLYSNYNVIGIKAIGVGQLCVLVS